MKQIINITFGGRTIPIEDSAYKNVQDYLESLRRYYKNEDGRDEIITDIENRFSELMSEKIRKGAPHITEADIEEMISIMGRPEDFDTAGQQTTGPNFTFGAKSRLYRDANNKILGGVCSGVANWLKIDPAVIRVLFAIITFGGFGSGILIYILLWIFLPATTMEVYKGKRMFRDPDNKVIGGVAGGLSAYFNIDAKILRLILVAPFIISVLSGLNVFGWHNDFHVFPNLFFGGLTGTFVFAYVVLWAVLPEARTPYDKMELKGKPVDLNAVKQNVQQNMGELKERLQNWKAEVKDSAKKFEQNVYSTSGTKVPPPPPYYTSHRRSGIGNAIAVFFKVVFIVIFGSIAFGLFIALLALAFSGFAWAPFNDFLWTSDNQQMLAWGTVLLFIGAPLLGMIIWLIRKIMNISTPGNYLGWLFGGLWTMGWLCLIFFLASITRDFKHSQNVTAAVAVTQPKNGKMIVTVSQPQLSYEGDFGWMADDARFKGLSFTKDTFKVSDVALNIEKSADSLYHVSIGRESFGRTDEEALTRANKINYQVSSRDSVLDLQNGFGIDKNSKYRFQGVVVTVQVPAGKKIEVDESVYSRLNSLDFNINGRRRNNNNHVHYRNRYQTNVTYTMLDNGSLQSATDDVEVATVYSSGDQGDNYRYDTAKHVNEAPQATDAKTDTVYRYDGHSQPANAGTLVKDSIRKALEEKEKEIEALKKQLKQ